MTDIILQFAAGGALLSFALWLKIHEFRKIFQLGAPSSPKLNAWIKTLSGAALSLIGAACMLDPLIPGSATLTIKVPSDASTYPTLLENLRVRVAPVGLLGQPGGNRISYAKFGDDGSAEVVSELSFLETHVTIQIFDETRPLEAVKSATVYVSPFVRRQLVTKTITF